MALSFRGAEAGDDPEQFFEQEIRPILIERCSRCHGAEKQASGLRIDSMQGLLKGGERGPALVPGDVAGSRLIEAVRAKGDLEMPPDKKLADREIRALTQWVKIGAPWPRRVATLPSSRQAKAKRHWAFQPVAEPELPDVKHTAWPRSPIDRFILSRLERSGLSPGTEADRRTIIRRASFALTGLPPSPEEVAAFVGDPDPRAYERLVDRLLDSPHYGEQWARHWLDVARYSDTKGYVYAREERFWTHAWSYRDWVVSALNDDMPYDRFLLLQLAADQTPDRAPDDLAAMGFLTLGRRFLGVKHDIIDDRIDVVCRGTMALTVGCARCHDHKYDPIPTADYYALYGVFDSCAQRLVALDGNSSENGAFDKELQKRQEALRTKMAAHRKETSDRVRRRVSEYLRAQTELEKYPADGFDQIFQKTDLLPAFVRRWEDYLRRADGRGDPVFTPWHAFAVLEPKGFAQEAAKVTQRLQASSADTTKINPIVARAFATPPMTFDEVIERYGDVFADIDAKWRAALDAAAKSSTHPPEALADASAEALRRVLYGPAAPCEAPDEPIVHIETFFDSAACTELWKLQGKVDRWIIDAKTPARFALTLVDRPQPKQPRIFRRGSPLNQGDEVPRRFLSLLANVRAKPFEHGSGRLEMTRAIIDPDNPLTARVIVNRVWAHHFGQGLVTTPSDFGLRAGDPSHPRLLDWLASRFVAEGWSLKKLHRRIMLSATFRQTSREPADNATAARARRIDPGNRLLWRMNQRRLTFEECRDSLLAASGELDRRLGGKPAKLLEAPYSKRRTLYGLVDRQFLPGALRMFDFANPDLHVSKRSETTVPQQALFFMNHPLVLERSKALAAAAAAQATPEAAVAALFQRTLQREPTAAEVTEALALVRAAETSGAPAPRATAADWTYGYATYDETRQRLKNFAALPHFTGKAWQGGEKWPDAKLGWVQLTAEGGHPGNDRQHAAVRRWTAPRDMTVAIGSKLKHEAAAGDGIRAFVIGGRAGELKRAKIHQKAVDLNVGTLAVSRGETIDFVVDIGDVLNSDQYVWTCVIREITDNAEAGEWNSQADFPRNTVDRLTAWEQLAQVLLCSNEFLFID